MKKSEVVFRETYWVKDGKRIAKVKLLFPSALANGGILGRNVDTGAGIRIKSAAQLIGRVPA